MDNIETNTNLKKITSEQSNSMEETKICLSIDKKKYIVTTINKELIYNTIGLDLNFIDIKIRLKNLYAFIGEDNSFMFVKERINYFYDNFYLVNVLDKQKIHSNYNIFNERGWTTEDIVRINNMNYVTLKASKIIPDYAIAHGKITEIRLRKLSEITKKYLIEHPEFVQNIFSQEKENVKVKK